MGNKIKLYMLNWVRSDRLKKYQPELNPIQNLK